MKKCVAIKRFIFKQLIDENKQLIDEKDVCMQTSQFTGGQLWKLSCGSTVELNLGYWIYSK